MAVPNTIIVAALAFSAAAAARSIAAAFCVAIVLPLIPLVAQGYLDPNGGGWLPLVDPFGLLAIVDVTRYWTGAELATDLPGGVLLVNRALWLGIAARRCSRRSCATDSSCSARHRGYGDGRASAAAPAPVLSGVRVAPRFGRRRDARAAQVAAADGPARDLAQPAVLLRPRDRRAAAARSISAFSRRGSCS